VTTDWQAVAERYKARIDVLEVSRQSLQAEITALETEVDRLEAEDLRPLVDRLMAQIATIKKLVASMASEIEDLNAQP
jgi:prefoldin subunit 5